ncbi:MAG: ABC-type transport auxiliary lipoprotein family protein [Arenimonas sp.]|uniref:ABC-type transport auxiliary lipoprotein family protein n=1 Tax=Arenimonas sp. TaxID=1872635 RepID=UPI0025BD726C|nr:ABC-type transport auxiliary lipoprotein family protein [Arenimonas sp.]MBW8367010.1 ABC-type transport auxiliary lipoprotein family protein [Arenimonas sp.]
MSRASLFIAAALALLLAGCGSIGGPKTDVTVYSPATAVTVDPSWPKADWSVSVGVHAANAMLDSPRIAVRPRANEIQTYKGARWADNAPDLLQTALVEAFEDSGRVGSVTRFGGGSTRGDYGLWIEVRQFETVYQGDKPEAVIEVQARLVKLRGGGLVASKRFRHAVAGSTPEVDDIVAAFGQAMSDLGTDVVGWTLIEGRQHEASTLAK